MEHLSHNPSTEDVLITHITQQEHKDSKSSYGHRIYNKNKVYKIHYCLKVTILMGA